MKILSKRPQWFKIRYKDGKVGPFTLNTAQKDLLDKINKDIEEKGRTRLIIVKGRQLGISTLIETLLLSYAMSEPAFTGYAMAHDATTANDLFDKIIKFEWQNMAEDLKSLYKLKRDNTRQLMFEGTMNSSSVTVGLSGRGNTIDFLHISEAGKISENRQLWLEMITGSFPAAEKAKGIVIESTADGGLGAFYELVQDALAGKNEFEVIFLSWTEAEEYQAEYENEEWIKDYERLANVYNLYRDPVERFGITKKQWHWYYKQANLLKEEVKVQYPFDIEEAFVSRARSKFDINQLKNIRPVDPIQIIDGVKIFKQPQANQIYSLGIDPSSGLGNDWSCISMRNFYTGQLVAQMKAKTRERETARIAVNLANWYNAAGSKTYIACEINGLGRAVQNEIQDMYDTNYIYKRYIQDITKKFDVLIPDFGFQTTNKNRDLIINNFVHAFIDAKLDMVNTEEIEEAKVFVWNDQKSRYEAQEGYTDDILFSDFICFDNFNYIRQYG